MSLSVKINLVAGAVAAVLASGSALAAGPSGTPAAVFYAGGGSAQANAFYVAACRVANNMDVYTTAAGALDGSYYFMYGTLTQAIGTVASGSNVVFVYKFNGGSYTNGVAPQTTTPAATTLSYPNVTTVVATGPGAGNACTTGLPTVTFGTSWGTLVAGIAPDFGLADVEVPMFQGFNNPSTNDGGKGDEDQNQNGGPAPTVGFSDGIYDNLFGVAVTADVYNGTGNSTVSGVAHPKTNFSRAEVAGILTGSIQNWNQLYADDGTQLAAGEITFLDRGEGSGTKASGNEYFLGYPGDGSSAQFPYSSKTTGGYCNGTPPTGIATGGITGVNCDGSPPVEPAGPPISDVWETSTNAVISDLLLAQANHVRTIAILGLENPPAQHQVSGANAYYFAAINGVPPSTAVTTGSLRGSGVAGDNINGAVTTYNNVITGQYDFFYQNSFNARSATLTPFASTFQTVLKTANFVGCNFGTGGAFPAALAGTLIDPDFGLGLIKGSALDSRNHVSSGPLQPKLLAAAAGIPLCTDTL